MELITITNLILITLSVNTECALLKQVSEESPYMAIMEQHVLLNQTLTYADTPDNSVTVVPEEFPSYIIFVAVVLLSPIVIATLIILSARVYYQICYNDDTEQDCEPINGKEYALFKRTQGNYDNLELKTKITGTSRTKVYVSTGTAPMLQYENV